MESLYLLIPVSLIFCIIAIAVFFWAVNSGQYDDLDGEAERLLFEQKDTASTTKTGGEPRNDSDQKPEQSPDQQKTEQQPKASE